MQKFRLFPFFSIQIFGEGAGGGDGGTGGGNAGGNPAGQTAAAPAQSQKGVKDGLADVQYGKQTVASDAGKPEGDVPDKGAAFDALIKGEYKEQYEQRIQDTIRRRLKGNEEIVNKYNALAPVLDLLGNKYGVGTNDVAALAKAIEEDESFYEDEALEKNLSVQQVKEMRKIRRENAEFKRMVEEAQNRQQNEERFAALMRDADAVKAVYPSFDLRAEIENEQFRQLLDANVPLQTAFEVLHKDEIIPAAMQYTAQRITEKVANGIRAGQKRPSEGAMGARSAVVTKSDVSQLTKADRDEIDRRVARGERIVF